MFNGLKIDLPASEQRKFARWVNKLSIENTAKCKSLIYRKTTDMEFGMKNMIRNKGIINFGFLLNSIRKTFRSDGMGSLMDIAPNSNRTPSGQTVSAVKYAPFVEFGTRPHTIQVKNAKVLAGYLITSQNIKTGKAKYGWMYFGKKVNHPGTKANPFFYPVAEKVTKEFVLELNKMGFK